MKPDFSALRKMMVQEQLLLRGIKDRRVIQAFEQVPRHKFVAEKYLNSAYADHPLAIGARQTISQPYMVALMSEWLELSGDERVLEIGTGSGYQTAILAELAAQVYSVERLGSLAELARKRLQDLKYQNIRIKIDDGTAGWPEFAAYDRIIVTAATPDVPRPLAEQLKVMGKLVIPLGGAFSQILTQITKHRDQVETKQICGCVFVPLVGQYVNR
ncbi:MAG: protein-L-isoaspartate(D-aspartate) O-methyltransferase [Candidatus Omnitrophica bacterium]|nr:protein-L-isoaspartate(D-aspartate) O-methyltransferase [Candidatus Omnitrophota bacterium]